jgi:hypothetical protein
VEKLRAIWQFLDGKKTAFAAAYWFIVSNVDVFFPKGVPDNINSVLVQIGAYLTFAGLGHKAIKSLSK